MDLSIKIEETDDDEFEVEASGEISELISDEDRDKFGLDNYTLKNAVENYKKKRPTDVFLCEPTPWNMYYETDDVSEIEKVIKVINTKVIEVKKFPVTIKRQKFENKNSSTSPTFTTSIEETVSDSTSSSWRNEAGLSVDQKIGYDIKAFSQEASLNFKRSWGSSRTRSQSMTFKSGSGAQMTLWPGQSATVSLKAYRKFVKVEITYKCSLEGHVGINYHERYKGHHWHFVPVEKILKAGRIKNSVIVKELMDIELYTDCSVVVT